MIRKQFSFRRYRTNLQNELDSAELYRLLASVERNGNRRDIFLQLAASELEHAEIWRRRLREQGVDPGAFKPSRKTRALGWLARHFGPRFVLPAISANEFLDRDSYAGQPDAHGLASAEQEHAKVLRAVVQSSTTPGLAGTDIAGAESWHRRGAGNDLRAAVLGVNDGLISNFCLLMGIAGSGSSAKAIVLAGVSGLVAGAFSMALGEWLSVTNARELALSQIAGEADELEQAPLSEQHELALIYQAKGLDKSDAIRIAERVMQDKEQALDTLAREELGIDPKELGGSPWSAASISCALFALGAALPLLPFVLLSGRAAITASIVAAVLALAGIGVLTSLFNGRSTWFSASRQIAICGVAAAFTYGVGMAFGASLA